MFSLKERIEQFKSRNIYNDNGERNTAVDPLSGLINYLATTLENNFNEPLQYLDASTPTASSVVVTFNNYLTALPEFQNKTMNEVIGLYLNDTIKQYDAVISGANKELDGISFTEIRQRYDQTKTNAANAKQYNQGTTDDFTNSKLDRELRNKSSGGTSSNTSLPTSSEGSAKTSLDYINNEGTGKITIDDSTNTNKIVLPNGNSLVSCIDQFSLDMGNVDLEIYKWISSSDIPAQVPIPAEQMYEDLIIGAFTKSCTSSEKYRQYVTAVNKTAKNLNDMKFLASLNSELIAYSTDQYKNDMELQRTKTTTPDAIAIALSGRIDPDNGTYVNWCPLAEDFRYKLTAKLKSKDIQRLKNKKKIATIDKEDADNTVQQALNGLNIVNISMFSSWFGTGLNIVGPELCRLGFWYKLKWIKGLFRTLYKYSVVKYYDNKLTQQVIRESILASVNEGLTDICLQQIFLNIGNALIDMLQNSPDAQTSAAGNIVMSIEGCAGTAPVTGQSTGNIPDLVNKLKNQISVYSIVRYGETIWDSMSQAQKINFIAVLMQQYITSELEVLAAAKTGQETVDQIMNIANSIMVDIETLKIINRRCIEGKAAEADNIEAQLTNEVGYTYSEIEQAANQLK